VCEADLEWLITDPEGLPLHLGRTRRYATADQRRALRARDGGCRWPGCDGQASWCIAHHEPPWDLDGATDIDKQALICKVHHWMRHHGGWSIELAPDATVTITSPDATTVRTETAAQARQRHLATDLIARDGPDTRPARPDPPRDDGADPPRAQPPPGPDTATGEPTDPPGDAPTLPGIASEDRAVYRAA
jgi:hypothetical protein